MNDFPPRDPAETFEQYATRAFTEVFGMTPLESAINNLKDRADHNDPEALQTLNDLAEKNERGEAWTKKAMNGAADLFILIVKLIETERAAG
jgi:hypothetical protein